MAETEKRPTGTIYDGVGRMLKGDGRGPSSAVDLLDLAVHKQLVGQPGASVTAMTDEDRIYLAPTALWLHKRLPLGLMADLAMVLTGGGRVGVVAFSQPSLDAVVRVLRAPDLLLTRAREAVEKTAAPFSVGTVWDGAGAYLDGDKGHAVGWQADEKTHVKAILNGSREATDRLRMLAKDRVYIMPRDYRPGGPLPGWIIGEMASALKSGRKLLLVAPNHASLHKLMKAVSDAAGLQRQTAGRLGERSP